MGQLLIVEDDARLGAALEKWLVGKLGPGAIVRTESVADARRAAAKSDPDVILTDLRLGDGSGLDVLKMAASLASKPAVIVLTGNATLETAVEALRLGAFDYLQKPYEEEHLLHTILRARESRRLKERVRDLSALTTDPAWSSEEAVQADPQTKKIFDTAGKLAQGDAPVLLTGESGVGKEVVARYVHARSARASEAFIALNCAAIPETLLEAELFGYEKGAFTGATTQRKGKFELAAGGTLFLDEIGELPTALQPKLLRVLDGHGFLRLGGQATTNSDARIIAATNRNIDEEVAAGRFRQDLFYRLNVGRIDILPLRERPVDILPLADRILEHLKRKYRRPGLCLSEFARKNMLNYSWPGNVRELSNLLERAAILSTPDEISELSLQAAAPAAGSSPPAGVEGQALSEILDSYERRLIEDSMGRNANNKAAVARELGLSKQLLGYKLKKYGLQQ